MNKQDQPLIFELSKEGRIGYSLPDLDVPEEKLPDLFDEVYIRHEDAKSARGF